MKIKYLMAATVLLSAEACLSLSFGPLAQAQPVPQGVPGVPSTRPSLTGTQASGSTGGGGEANKNAPKLLTGQVKTNMSVAEKMLSQGKWSEAEGMFRDALVGNPQDAQATIGLGIALANEFKLDAADALFDRVMTQDANNPSAYAGKALVSLNRLQSSSGTIRANRESILKLAEDFARKGTTLGPANAEAHVALGEVLKEEGKFDEALSELNTATRLDPEQSYAYSSLGTIKLQQNSTAEAAAFFKQAVDLNSSNSTAHYGLGAAFLKQGQTDDAIKELNTSLYQYPNSWPTRMALGDAYAIQGNTVAALQQYQLSTLIKPENAEPYLKAADIHQGRGDLELAIAELRSGLTQSPYDVHLRQRIADIDLQLERPEEAIKGYRTVLQENPTDSNAIKGLSQALYLKAQKATVGAMLQTNDFDAANKSLDEAIKLNPNDMELRLAQVKLASLAGDKAVIAPLTGNPTNDGERVCAAAAAMRNNEYQKAKDLLAPVISNQTDPKQAAALGDVCAMMRALDSAEAAFVKAQSLSAAPDRVDRGLKQVAQLRQSAVENTRVAHELARKHEWDGAMVKYRDALASNPLYSDAHYGLAEALDDGPKDDTFETQSESAHHYQYYLSLEPNISSDKREKITDMIDDLNENAAKLKHKEQHQD